MHFIVIIKKTKYDLGQAGTWNGCQIKNCKRDLCALKLPLDICLETVSEGPCHAHSIPDGLFCYSVHSALLAFPCFYHLLFVCGFWGVAYIQQVSGFTLSSVLKDYPLWDLGNCMRCWVLNLFGHQQSKCTWSLPVHSLTCILPAVLSLLPHHLLC